MPPAANAVAKGSKIGLSMWRILGATRHGSVFADLIKLGKEEERIVRSFTRAYDAYVFGKGSASSLKTFEKYRDLIVKVIEKRTRGRNYERFLRAVYSHDMAVQFRLKGAVKPFLEAMKQSADKAAKEALAFMDEAQTAQALAGGLVKLTGSTGKRKAFEKAFKFFSQVLSPQAEELAEVYVYIVKHQDELYKLWKARAKNPIAYENALNKIKSLLHETYTALSPTWLAKVSKAMRDARKIADKLGKGWKVKRVTGGMRVFGREVWDEAILLVRRNPDGTEDAILYMAAQFKAEKKLSALKQIMRDLKREADFFAPYADEFSFIPNILTVTEKGATRAYKLLPNPEGQAVLRYIANTDGAKISAAHEVMLSNAGVKVEQLVQDISANGMGAIADAFLEAVLRVLN